MTPYISINKYFIPAHPYQNVREKNTLLELNLCKEYALKNNLLIQDIIIFKKYLTFKKVNNYL